MSYKEDLLKGKAALITGGRSGIGYEIAKRFLELGASVFICSRNEEKLMAAAKTLEAYGPVYAQKADIREGDDLDKLFDFIQEKTGRLDILVNNAGGQFPSLAEDLSDNGWSAVVRNSLNGTFFVTKRAAQRFFIPQKSGSIVNILLVVNRGIPSMVHAASARAGIETLSKSLAVEWGEYGIRINNIAAGPIETSGIDNYPEEYAAYVRDVMGQNSPLGRIGQVDDMINATIHLASHLSSYTTGDTIYVDGGLHLSGDNTIAMQLIKKLKKT